MTGRKIILPLLALIMGSMIYVLSGCSVLSEIELPPLPVFPSETAVPTKTPKPTRSPSPSPALTPSPSPASSDAPSPQPSAEVSADISVSATQVMSSHDETNAELVPAPVPIEYSTPTLTIENQTLPSDMTVNSVFGLYGTIHSDCGSITYVVGTLFHGSGEIAQQTEYYPYTDYFSLAGTINNDLHFAALKPDTYIYQVEALAENGTASADSLLINHAFTVVEQPKAPSSGVHGSYTAKRTDDTDNAAQIWNYFIDEFHNPYAAAAILGNIYTESGCDPMRVEGDLSGSFSKTYTEQVDSGALSRGAFTGYLPGDKYGHGYGLCQWSAERKGNLYDLAVSRGSSVGDLAIQCEFIMQELGNEYPTLLEYLWSADDAEAAAFEFCTVYEKAAVHGGRTGYAKDYLEKYAS